MRGGKPTLLLRAEVAAFCHGSYQKSGVRSRTFVKMHRWNTLQLLSWLGTWAAAVCTLHTISVAVLSRIISCAGHEAWLGLAIEPALGVGSSWHLSDFFGKRWLNAVPLTTWDNFAYTREGLKNPRLLFYKEICIVMWVGGAICVLKIERKLWHWHAMAALQNIHNFLILVFFLSDLFIKLWNPKTSQIWEQPNNGAFWQYQCSDLKKGCIFNESAVQIAVVFDKTSFGYLLRILLLKAGLERVGNRVQQPWLTS